MANIARRPQALVEAFDTFTVWDDFFWYVTAHQWTSLAADSGSSCAVGTQTGGSVVLTTGATNNNEVAVYTTAAVFKPAGNKPLECEALVQYAEAATNAANIFFGLASSFGANLLVDDGAGPRTSGTVIGLYKVDGGTVWRCVSRNGTAVTDSISTTTAGGTIPQKLGIEIVDVTSTTCTVIFTVDGAHLRDATTNAIIRHSLDISSAPTAAALGAYVKDGSGTGEVLNVDYILGTATR